MQFNLLPDMVYIKHGHFFAGEENQLSFFEYMGNGVANATQTAQANHFDLFAARRKKKLKFALTRMWCKNEMRKTEIYSTRINEICGSIRANQIVPFENVLEDSWKNRHTNAHTHTLT